MLKNVKCEYGRNFMTKIHFLGQWSQYPERRKTWSILSS